MWKSLLINTFCLHRSYATCYSSSLFLQCPNNSSYPLLVTNSFRDYRVVSNSVDKRKVESCETAEAH